MEKTLNIKHKRIDKYGNETYYIEKRVCKLRGYAQPDGSRKFKSVFSDEQRAEIIRKYSEGVRIKRLQKDYNATYYTLKKLIDDANNHVQPIVDTMNKYPNIDDNLDINIQNNIAADVAQNSPTSTNNHDHAATNI